MLVFECLLARQLLMSRACTDARSMFNYGADGMSAGCRFVLNSERPIRQLAVALAEDASTGPVSISRDEEIFFTSRYHSSANLDVRISACSEHMREPAAAIAYTCR